MIRLAPVEGESARFTVGFRRKLLKANAVNEKRLFGKSPLLYIPHFMNVIPSHTKHASSTDGPYKRVYNVAEIGVYVWCFFLFFSPG